MAVNVLSYLRASDKFPLLLQKAKMYQKTALFEKKEDPYIGAVVELILQMAELKMPHTDALQKIFGKRIVEEEAKLKQAIDTILKLNRN